MTQTDSGSALVLALLVAFIMSLLGISFLVMAATESRIAENERRAAQALYAAESGARAVKRWFDRPGSFFHFPPPEVVARGGRRVLNESDPYGAPATPADGSSIPRYKQGVDLDGNGIDDLFRPPYRGDSRNKLMGSEDGPDMLIDDEETVARAFLEELSRTLFGDDESPVAPLLRISRIEICAPPYLRSGTRFARYGIATVRVTARMYHAGDRRVLAEREFRGVLNEVPYRGPYGPLHSCADLVFTGLPLTVHWGAITAVGQVKLSDVDQLPSTLLRRVPPSPKMDVLYPADPAVFDTFKNTAPPGGFDTATFRDPWLRILSTDHFQGAPAGTQPWPPPQRDSYIVQDSPIVNCPQYDYATWKAIAGSGGSDTHYYAHAGGTTFKENGLGVAKEFEEITREARGLAFFDTIDGLEPRDADGDGRFENLTPDISLDGGGVWAPRGLLFLNANRFKAGNVSGQDLQLRAPGEPFHDADLDGRFDVGEGYVNLVYGASPVSSFQANRADTYGGAEMRNPRGPATNPTPISMEGILYTSGYFEGSGPGTFYGSVIAQAGVVQLAEDGSLPTPQIFWDESIVTGWPPAGSSLPRVFYTRWVTEP